MFETYQICPYTGLRSFTEEESLYFKGREDDINRATEQLQRNKFLMLTGASGDGKSSLIYAGIIPNARSGFLKSKYSSWCIADFRPERTPFQNLCKSVATQLGINNPGTVQAELNHGFSALVDLYKNSKRFIDTNSFAWQKADTGSKAILKRQAANLIILVDQFEEFFTNPENYKNGVPSKDSNLVLNILLETAHIALEEDLPIYIVFTMRSDYIGQCAAFRGLPEYIGFSQFFVPHLNRTQLQQVIEEPATLSENQITRRLTERLIHDITEGTDQLPILQHALSQIWVAANRGSEEMDLLHYAMVGGMAPAELPDEHVERFNEWFNSLPSEIQVYYHTPNLQNVLDTHTNKLYGEAAGYYADATGEKISADDAKLIIRNAFSCLTKIDESRAVRNRMTLEEITNILGMSSFNAEIVGNVLNAFRKPGNTFIRPFILEEDEESQKLLPTQVLDITHESLIRNWQYLGKWAKEEFESYSIFVDFERQLNRWVKSGKSNAFLLSIGPLTYFETWYKKAKPNEWWIARYLPGDFERQTKLERAKEILKDTKEFLAKSSRKHFITRALIHYGAKRIAIVIGIIALITLTSFVARDYLKKQNSYVLKSIHQQTLNFADDPKIDLANKAILIAEELKLGNTSIDEIANAIKDTIQKIKVLDGIAGQLILQGRDEPKNQIFKCLSKIDSLLEPIIIPANNSIKLSLALSEINNYRVELELAYYYNADILIDTWRKRNAARSARWVLQIANTQTPHFDDIQNFNLALENAINYHAFTNDDIKNLLSILSPFENGLKTDWLKSNYHPDKLLIRGFLQYGFKFNGLYQELAYLYSASGNSEKAIQCVDTLLRYSQNNYTGDYAAGADNAANIAAVYFKNNKTDKLDDFVRGYCLRKKITEEEFYAKLIGRTLPGVSAASNTNLYWWSKRKNNLILKFCNRDQLTFFFNKYREVVQSSIKDHDQKNFLIALSFKNEGIEKSLNKEQPGKNELTPDQFFDQAFAYYTKVSSSYLNQSVTVVGVTGSDELVAPRKFIFIYPDLRLSFHPDEPRTFFHFSFTDSFLAYIINKKLFDALYPGQEELNYFTDWLRDYNAKNFVQFAFLIKSFRYEILNKLDESLEKRNIGQNLDFNLLYLYLGKDAQQAGDSAEMFKYYRKIQTKKLFNILQFKEFAGQINDQSFRMIAFAIEGLTKFRHFELAHEFISMFKNPINRSSLYSFVADDLARQHAAGNIVASLIDSAKAQMNLAVNITEGQPNKELLAAALILQSPSQNAAEAFRLIKNIPEKFDALRNICRSYAFHGDIYKAKTDISPLISSSDLASFYWYILHGYAERNGAPAKEWIEYDGNYFSRLNLFIRYIDENS
ncbi:MAG TPA: hypothetical protein VKR53_03505 [Puia sp.]|nr:hypothetical protein [Puia sp.]